jgi:hypothetical protein
MHAGSGSRPGRTRARAGGEDHVPRHEAGHRLAVLRHGHLARAASGDAVQPASAVEHGHLVLLQEVLYPAGELRRDATRALDDLGDVEADVLGREAIGVEVVQEVVDLRRAQQRLGRYAAPVEADAAQVLALDERDVHL